MFRHHRMRPSKVHHNDQLPFLSRGRFSALPEVRVIKDEIENLSLFVAVLYVIDLFGIFPFVTLPGLIVELGFFGIPLIVSVVLLQIYTSFLLSECWTMAEILDPSIVQKSSYPYAAITDLAFGRYARIFVTVLLNLSVFTTGIPNLVVAAQNMELVGQRMSDGAFILSYCYWVLVVGAVLCGGVLVWIGSPKHMRGVALLSVCVVITIVILLWICLFESKPLGAPFEGIRRDLPPLLTILQGYSILAFQFDIHPMLLTLQIDMEHKSKVYWAAFSGILVTTSIAIFTAIIATYKFGSMISENLLETLPKSVLLYLMLILMALQLCFSAAAMSTTMFLQFENFFRVSQNLSIKRIAIRSSIVALQILIAEFVPSFDVLMGVIGGTITGPLIFILPPLLYRRICRLDRCHQRDIVEVAYGSITPIDLNYEHMDMEPLSGALDQSFHGRWLQAVQACKRIHYNLFVSMVVLFFGITATFCSTYLNLFRLSELFTNNSPCFGNLKNISHI